MFKINKYYEGNVMSFQYKTKGGDATIGVMSAGEYEFETTSVEYVTVTSGKMFVKLPTEEDWKVYGEFETFIVDKNTRFKVKMESDVSYRCLYR